MTRGVQLGAGRRRFRARDGSFVRAIATFAGAELSVSSGAHARG